MHPLWDTTNTRVAVKMLTNLCRAFKELPLGSRVPFQEVLNLEAMHSLVKRQSPQTLPAPAILLPMGMILLRHLNRLRRTVDLPHTTIGKVSLCPSLLFYSCLGPLSNFRSKLSSGFSRSRSAGRRLVSTSGDNLGDQCFISNCKCDRTCIRVHFTSSFVLSEGAQSLDVEFRVL